MVCEFWWSLNVLEVFLLVLFLGALASMVHGSTSSF